MKRNWSRCVIGFIVLTLLLSMPLLAYKVKGSKSNLDSLAFVAPELRVSQTGEDFRAIKEGFSSFDGGAKFLSENDGSWRILIDLRRGVPSLIEGGAIPWIPGPANSLSWSSFGAGCNSIQCIPREKVEEIARSFLDQYPGLFPVKQEELVLDPSGTVPVWDSIYLVRFQWTIDGIPVEGASIYFIINNGNLISVSSTRLAPQAIDTTPAVTKETAWDIMNGYLGGEGVTEKDEVLERGRLSIIPATRKGIDTFKYSGTIGSMADYRLVYKMVFRRPGFPGTWEAVVDAHSGELLRFVDMNRYGRIHGGAKTSDDIPPDQDVPFPFADIGGGLYTDALGNFSGNDATSTLSGRYAIIADACGSISLTTTTGDADFLTDLTTDTDCTVPSGNSAGLGNTKSARTQFYNLTAINLKAQVYNPTNTWLTSYTMTANTNGSPYCNASSGGGVVNFYQHVAGSCNNLGEIPGVSMHEWAHAYDAEDGSGDQSPPLETYADFTAIIQTHNSCTGAGFLIGSNCDGYGDACTDCTGVRDCDWRAHAANTPWTVANNAANGGTVWDSCGTGSYQGPCNWEDHCEAGFSTQALWDFATHDLTDYCGLDLTTAWMLLDRLWFTGVITIDDMYTCDGASSDGCTGNTLYNVMRTLDDDGDGLANGTPHAQAIFQALDRHGIACGLAGDATNQNYTSCPSLTTPTLTASGGNNSVKLDWTTGGANATRYYIYKNASNCDVAFNRIAIVTAPTLTYTDNACLNGYTYYYRVQAATDNDSCVSTSSNCATGIPVECTGAPALDKTLYNCVSTVTVTVGDSSAPTSPFTCEAWSTSDTTHRTFTMSGVGSPYTGSFTTTLGTGGPSVVHVANGDTLYVQYTDPDNCGSGSLDVQTTATIDCVGPVISNVSASVAGITATITWDTNEPSDSRVYYSAGTAGPPWTEAYSSALTTSHSIEIPGLPTCTRFYYYVESTDGAGNTAYDNNGGSYYFFVTGLLVDLVNEDFEGTWGPLGDNPPDGWTIEDHGSVPGTWDTNDWYNYAKGGSYGAVARVYYSPVEDQDDWLITPAFAIEDNLTSVDLEFDHYFNWYHAGDYGYVDYTSDQHAGWTTLATYSDDTADMAHETLSLNSYLGDTNARIRFRFVGNNGYWWEVDNVIVRGSGTCASSMGSISLDAPTYICGGDTITVTIRDTDLSGSAQATVTTTGGDSETVTCSETGVGVFTGTISTAVLPVSIGNGLVNVGNGETITATYHDVNDGTGNPADVYDTAVTDCVGPVITDVLITNVTPTTATVTWTTSEPANSRVTYGTSTPPGTNADDLASYVTSHTMVLSGLSTCTTYYLSVTSADIYSNSVTDTNGGSYYTFTTQGMAYAFGPFDVESGTDGWTLTGQWHQDNCKYHSGTYAMKSGSTTCPGAYDSSTTSDMTWDSDIDLGSTGHGYHLRYWEYYQSESCCDDLRPQISTDGGTTWVNLTEYAGTGTTWAQRDINLAAYTGNIRLRFEMYTDGSLTGEGWYLDDIEISKNQGCSVELLYQSRTMTEACNGTGTGGGNTILEPGEDATIGITMFNNGVLSATGVSATLTSTTPGVTVTTNTANFPTIASEGTGTSLTNYLVHVDSSVTCVTTANFTLHSTSNENPTGTDSYFTIDVGLAGGAVSDFSENFASVTVPGLPAGWTTYNAGSGNNWDTYNSYACSSPNNLSYRYNSSYAADCWAFTPGITLTAGVTYTLNFTERIASTTWPESFEVRCGTAATVGGQTITILAEATYNNTTCATLSPTFTVPTTGTYYISFHCTSATNMFYLTIDDINLTHDTTPTCNVCTSDCTNPTQPTIASVVDNDPDVQNGVTVTFTAGSPSTSNSLLVDTVEVATGITSPYVYNPGDTASHSYVVRTYNTPSCHTDSGPVSCTDEEETAVIPGEVASGTNFTWTGQTMGWTADGNATGYRVYRGLLSNLSALCDATNDFCLRNDGAGTSLDVTGDDAAGATGRCFYYLITGYSGAGEGPAGTATCGARTVNSSGGCL